MPMPNVHHHDNSLKIGTKLAPKGNTHKRYPLDTKVQHQIGSYTSSREFPLMPQTNKTYKSTKKISNLASILCVQLNSLEQIIGKRSVEPPTQ